MRLRFLGDLYYLGVNMKKNLRAAKKYWKMALEQNNEAARARLANPKSANIKGF